VLSITERIPTETVFLRLVADPGIPTALVRRLAATLEETLAEDVTDRWPWKVDVVSERIPADERGRIHLGPLAVPHGGSGVVVVYVTDQPRRAGVRPIVADVALTSGVAVVSLPALGGRRVRSRLQQIIVTVTRELVAEELGETLRPSRLHRVSPVDEADVDVRFLGGGHLSRFRLLVGMIRANRPWRMITNLSKAFAGAVGVGAYVLLTTSVWKVADSLDWLRLTVAAALAIAAMVVWLIVDHHMWERPADHPGRALAVLYNTTTAVTLTAGVLTMYAGVFVLGLVAQAVMIEHGLLVETLGHAAGWSDRMRLVWFSASLATVGGALGTGFESDEAVRAAAYGYRQRQRRRNQDQAAGHDDGSGDRYSGDAGDRRDPAEDAG
jgi:hypothetical protein